MAFRLVGGPFVAHDLHGEHAMQQPVYDVLSQPFCPVCAAHAVSVSDYPSAVLLHDLAVVRQLPPGARKTSALAFSLFLSKDDRL
jgi:hypothetical protein